MTGYEIKAQQSQPVFRKDNSIKIGFETGELSVTDKTKILERAGELGTLIFVPDDEVQAPPEKIEVDMKKKSLTTRLYNVIYVYWQQCGAEGDFEIFRRNEMERLINQYKDKLI